MDFLITFKIIFVIKKSPLSIRIFDICKIDPSSIAYMAASDNGFVLPKGSIESAHVGIVAVKEIGNLLDIKTPTIDKILIDLQKKISP